MFGPFGFPGFGILPSYYPYLAAVGLGRCNCPNTLQFLPSFFFTGVTPQPGVSPFLFAPRRF
jgi:hypothetical protein